MEDVISSVRKAEEIILCMYACILFGVVLIVNITMKLSRKMKIKGHKMSYKSSSLYKL